MLLGPCSLRLAFEVALDLSMGFVDSFHSLLRECENLGIETGYSVRVVASCQMTEGCLDFFE